MINSFGRSRRSGSAISVARSYVNEATGTLQGHTVNMALFLGRNRQLFDLDRRGFSNLMTGQARALGLVNAAIVTEQGTPIVKANIRVRGTLPDPPDGFLRSVDDGKPSCILPRTRNVSACAESAIEATVDARIAVIVLFIRNPLSFL